VLSLALFFEDKVKRGDKDFEQFMLPHIYFNLTSSLSKTAKKAFEGLRSVYPTNQHVQQMHHFGMLVANMTNNHCALGVYFLQQSEGNSTNHWELICEKDFSFPAGTLFRFAEPLVPALKEEETRIYATLTHLDTRRYVYTTG
jgi:hypothetical protein